MIIKFPYNETVVERIKEIPGRRWDADEGGWSIPDQYLNIVSRILEMRYPDIAKRVQVYAEELAPNAQALQVAAQAEVQKNQAITQNNAQLEQVKAELKTEQMNLEVEHKMKLMQFEFEINQKLQQMNMQQIDMKETMKEDRKDNRSKMQASQQSELIDQRLNKKPPKNFESSGNDILGGNFGLGRFEPS